jgi:hypothetical protein
MEEIQPKTSTGASRTFDKKDTKGNRTRIVLHDGGTNISDFKLKEMIQRDVSKQKLIVSVVGRIPYDLVLF